MSEPLLKMYAVRNSDGLYFRARGYSGYGKMWVEDLKFAKNLWQTRSSKISHHILFSQLTIENDND